MDLIPSPDQVVSAAANIAQLVVSGGLADLRPMARTLIDDGPRREVYHYQPLPGVPEQGDPVLLVTPLAAPSLCFDLRRGCSLVERLVEQGRPTYLVEYGEVSLKDRSLVLEHWVDGVVPAAIRAVSEHAGNRPVHLVGWSLGGIFALLVAAGRAGLPIASVTALGAPVDVRRVPLLAPSRPLLDLSQGQRGTVGRVLQAVAGAAAVRWALQLPVVQRLVTDPIAIGLRLDETDFLAQVESVSRFQSSMAAYPGRSFGQLYHRFLKNNAMITGSVDIAGRRLSLADVGVPVLVVAGAADGIAPVPSVQAVMPLLSGSREARFEIVPGGHLGLLTGRAARTSTWVVLDEWLTEWSRPTTSPGPADPRGRKSPAEKAPAKKAPAKKAPAKKTAPRKSAAKQAAPKTASRKRAQDADEIGTNPQRRYGSGGSRSLSR